MLIRRTVDFLIGILLCLSASALVAQSPAGNLIPITVENADQLQQIARLGNGVFTGSAAYNSTGDTLAVGGSIGLWLYDGHDPTATPRLLDLDAWVSKVEYSADDAYLAFMAGDTAYVVDATSLETVFSVPSASSFALSSTSHEIAVATWAFELEWTQYPEFTISLWDIDQAQQTQIFPKPQQVWNFPVQQMEFSPDGRHLAVLRQDYPEDNCGQYMAYIELWDIQNLESLPRRLNQVEAFAFHPEQPIIIAAGHYADSVSSYTNLNIWNYETGSLDDFEFPQDETNDMGFPEPNLLRFDMTGRYFTAVGFNTELWDYQQKRLITQLDYSDTKGIFLGAIAGRAPNQWLFIRRRELLLHDIEGQASTIYLASSMRDAQIMSNGIVLEQVTANVWGLWRINEAEPFITFEAERVYSAADTIAYVIDDYLHIFNTTEASETSVIWLESSLQEFALSDDGQQFAYRTETIFEWREADENGFLLGENTRSNSFRFPEVSAIQNLSFLTGSHILRIDSIEATTSNEIISVFSETDWRFQGYPSTTQIYQSHSTPTRLFLSRKVLARGYLTDIYSHSQEHGQVYVDTIEGEFSLFIDSTTFITRSKLDYFEPEILNFWDTETLTIKTSVYYGGDTFGMDAGFLTSPDGSRIITFESSVSRCGGDSNSMSLWNTETGEAIYNTWISPVYARGFSKDSNLFALASRQELSLWGIQNSSALIWLDRHTDNIYDVTFTTDGTRILTASADGTVRVWGIP